MSNVGKVFKPKEGGLIAKMKSKNPLSNSQQANMRTNSDRRGSASGMGATANSANLPERFDKNAVHNKR